MTVNPGKFPGIKNLGIKAVDRSGKFPVVPGIRCGRHKKRKNRDAGKNGRRRSRDFIPAGASVSAAAAFAVLPETGNVFLPRNGRYGIGRKAVNPRRNPVVVNGFLNAGQGRFHGPGKKQPLVLNFRGIPMFASAVKAL